MNKKTLLIFAAGAVSSGAVFAAIPVIFKKPVSEPAAAVSAKISSTPELPKSTLFPVPSQPSEASALKAMLSPEPDAHSVIHEVAPLENLTQIAKRYRVTIDLVKKVNGLSSDKLLRGQKLKIPAYKFSIVVDKSQNTLLLKGDEEALKTYVVSTGANNGTPAGTFKITDKLIDPTWYKAGAVVPPGSKDNVLGTRWLGLTAKGYGIHGTVEPGKLGQQVTEGCVRMRNEEVEELYSIVPAGTEVTVVD